MSKTKPSGPTHYEVLFIIPNKFTEEEAKTIIENVKKTIIDNQGEITHDEYWGKKRLAYKIKHNTHGYYALFEFDLESNHLAEIENTFRLSKDILRHQVVKLKKKTTEQIAREKKINDKINSDKEKEEKANKPKENKKEDKKVDLKDLNKKLEGILNAKDLI